MYYLGELIRQSTSRDGAFFGPDAVVTAADCEGGLLTGVAPLFRVHRDSGAMPGFARDYPDHAMDGSLDGDDPLWAARVKYRGKWYFAGPASPIDAECAGNKVVDRSATMLTLVSQILEMNRSPESVVLPSRL